MNNGFEFAIIRCYEEVGQPDPNCPASIQAAWNGGMNYVDVYFYPDMNSNNPADQAASMVNFLQSNGITRNGAPPNGYGMVWIDIEGWADWSSDQDYNRNFFVQLVQELQNLGQVVGVYTSASQWGPIMDNGWTGGADLALWYPHYDGDASFDDFSSFGGWGNPSIKQYQGTTGLCGAGFDLNWYPDGFNAFRNGTRSASPRVQ